MTKKDPIRIEPSDNGYRFFIYPAAYLINQAIGHSPYSFHSKEECMLAIDELKAFVKSVDLHFGDEQYIKYEKGDEEHHKQFGFYFVDDSGKRLFESGFRYSHKENCKNGIEGVIRTLKGTG